MSRYARAAHGDIQFPASVKTDDRVRFRRAIVSSNCYDAMGVPAAMSKTMRLLAALPTAQKRLTFEMEIRPFGEKWQNRYLSNDNKRN
jgi:hypothetical protein